MSADDDRGPALNLRSPALWAIVALSVAVVSIFAGVIAAWPRFTRVSLGMAVSGDISPEGVQWQSLRSTRVKALNVPDGTCPVAPAMTLPEAGATGPKVYGVNPVHTTGMPAAMSGSPGAVAIRFYVNRGYHGPILVRIRSLGTGAPVGISPAELGSGQGSVVQPRPGARLVDARGAQIIDKTGQHSLPTYAELDIPAGSAQQTAGSSSVDLWTAYISPEPGCFSMQIDGLGFSELMAFQVQLLNRGPLPFGKSGAA
jgi:hypothetical protein